MTSTAKPRVALIGTGGTISSIGRDSLDVWEYMDTSRKAEPDELLQRFPEVAGAADIVTVCFRAVGSTAIGPADWLALDAAVHDAVARESPLDGLVITHGTATLEETAYFLNLTLKVDVPVVVVGAQRPATGLSSDAAMNLLNAVRVAGAPAARGLGVLVLLNDEIQAAREVTKASTLRVETFRSHDLGMLGYADPDGRIAIYRKPTRRHAPDTEFDVRGRTELPRVDIVASYAGADGAAIDAFVAAGARAIATRCCRHAGAESWWCSRAGPAVDACCPAPCSASAASSSPTISIPRRRACWRCSRSPAPTIRSRSSACSTSTERDRRPPRQSVVDLRARPVDTLARPIQSEDPVESWRPE
jgi:L-asparaginase